MRTREARSSSVITEAKSRRPLAHDTSAEYQTWLMQGEDVGPQLRWEVDEDRVPHRRDLTLHVGAALLHAGVGR